MKKLSIALCLLLFSGMAFSQDSKPGSQLIFIADVDEINYISVTNTADKMAVTTLWQYYNDEIGEVLAFLRIIGAGETVLVNPFVHQIPGVEGDKGSIWNVFAGLPMDSMEKPGRNSDRFLVTVTAVGANVDVGETENGADVVNVLFPTNLAKGMHASGMDNIDNCGVLKTVLTDVADPVPAVYTRHLVYTPNGTDGANDCSKAADDAGADMTSKNVGDLTANNADPIAFNYLVGHQTSAQVGMVLGGSDQTSSWGVNALVRMGVVADSTEAQNYNTLEGTASTDDDRLEEVAHGGMPIDEETREALTGDAKNRYAGTDASDKDSAQMARGINGGYLSWTSLYTREGTTQAVQFLSVADDFGGDYYQLIPAMTKYSVQIMDNQGDMLDDPKESSSSIFRGAPKPEDVETLSITVKGLLVYANAGACGSDQMLGPQWSLSDAGDISSDLYDGGATDYDGLDADSVASENTSRGWVKFVRSAQECKEDYGDGDSSTGSTVELDDNIPPKDERIWKAGTLIEEKSFSNNNRVFVTAGQVILKYETPDATFGAAWWLVPSQ